MSPNRESSPDQHDPGLPEGLHDGLYQGIEGGLGAGLHEDVYEGVDKGLHDGLTPGSESGGALTPLKTARATSTETTVEADAGPQWDGGGAPPSSGGGWNSGQPEAPESHRMSFLDHLEELRRRIIRSLLAVAVGCGVCWTFADELYAGLARPVTQILTELHMDPQLVYTSPTAPFTLYVRLAMLAGLFVASPYVLYQVWGFISPGLYPHEKRYAFPFVVLCSGLFIAGGAFAYLVAFPAALRFLLTFAHQFRPMITVNEYFSLAITIILGLAIVFELPVLILVLTFLRLLTPGFLFRNSRYAILLIFITAAAITPTPDVPTMMLFAMPLIGLYFFGIGLSYVVLWARGRKQES
ncbi:MAG TPA: twin-arginine translocase subunit TatC [Anaerolineales bacterium]|nr:twin-arginine translocase subunit TatC [Anaerolineales bacterium]